MYVMLFMYSMIRFVYINMAKQFFGVCKLRSSLNEYKYLFFMKKKSKELKNGIYLFNK